LTKNETATTITYRATFPMPVTGWLAFFIQLNFLTVENNILEITTEANIIPETYPFKDCTLEGCYGTLV